MSEEAQVLAFASEEAKIEALDKVSDTPESLAEIQRIMDAPITPAEAKPAVPTAETPLKDPVSEEPSLESPTLKPEAKPESKADVIAIALSELPEEYRNFDNAGKLLKKIKNQDETIARQTQFIRERISQTQPDEVESVRRENEDLRRKLESASFTGREAAPENKVAAAQSQSRLDEIVKRRKALLEKHKDVEDQQFDADFLRENNQLQDLMLEEMGRLNGALERMSSDVEVTKKQASAYTQSRTAEDQKTREDQVYEQQIKTVQSFIDKKDELKLSKPLMEVDKEYADYQRSVASVYWGRLARDTSEVQTAMAQLQRKSPSLMSALQAAQLPTEPTPDMEKYLAACEIWDNWQGVRKDPLTGDFRRDHKTGRVLPLMRWDPVTKRDVPDTYPSIEAAYNDSMVRGGVYTQKVIDAFKQGGKAAAEARARRDGGVVEMDNASGGKPRVALDQALDEINKIDEREMILEAREGNPAKLKRYNELAQALGWSQVQ